MTFRLLPAAMALVAVSLLPIAALADPAHDAAARYVAWRGGDAFARARGLWLRGITDDGHFPGRFERRIEPGRTYERTEIGSAVTRSAFIGSGGWNVTLSGQTEDAGTEEAKLAARRREVLFDDAFQDPKAPLTLEPDETFDGRTVQVLRVTFGPKDRFEWLLDPATGALVADRETDDGLTTVSRYDDWRTVHGVKIAFRTVQRVASDPITTTITVTAAEVDPKPDPAAFKRPASRRLYAFDGGAARTQPLPFEFYLGSRIYIPAQLNGAETHVLLDSGAEATVLDKAYAASLGIRPTAVVPAVGTGGRDVAELASGVTLRVGALELKDLTVALIDLKPIAAAIGRPLTVVMGKEVFDSLVVDLDFAGRTIAFEDPARFRPSAGAVAVPITNVGGIHAIPARMEGGKAVLMDFDLGNGQPLLVNPGYWKPAKMLEGRASSKTMSGAIGGMRLRDLAVVKTLTLAGVTLHDIPAIFGDDDQSAVGSSAVAGNIGLPILSRFALTTDYARGRILLTPRPDAIAEPFPKDRSGLSARLAGQAFAVSFVAPGSPAEAAGLKVGQMISALDGKPAAEAGMAGLAAARTGPAGGTIRLTLSDGRAVELVRRDYF